jgi:hypothetical protein
MFAPIAVMIGISVAIMPDKWARLGTSEWLFWGGLVLLILIGMAALPSRYFLLLAPDGLTVQYVGRKRHYTWDEMRDFRAVKVVIEPRIPVAEKVAFDLVSDSSNRGGMSRVAGAVLGYEVSILNMYRIKTADLIALLYEWQERYSAYPAAAE